MQHKLIVFGLCLLVTNLGCAEELPTTHDNQNQQVVAEDINAPTTNNTLANSTGKIQGSSSRKQPISNTFYIGRVYHEASQPHFNDISDHDYTLYKNFRGLRAAFQRVHSEHLASLYALETARLDTMTLEDNERIDTRFNLTPPEKMQYVGLKSSIIASTNLRKGWQFYLGGGLFYDTYIMDSGNRDNYGVRYDFGFGHSWYHCQAMLRFSGDLTNSQSESGAESSELVMDFGYNF